MTTRLRLVVFTSGALTPLNRVFFERLAQDPLLDLAAIVVDEYQPRRKPLVGRVLRALREDGASWLAFKIGSKLRSFREQAVRRLADWIHRPRPEKSDVTLLEESYVTLAARTGAAIHRVSDIHDAENIALIRSLSPELGIIVGTRILRDAVISIPTHGTLNIHKRKLPDYRGGGPVGYWEILAGEQSLGVTIHYATAQVDAGPVLAEETISIEPGDTLESLKLKADLRGAQLYHDTLRRFAQGHRDGVAQEPARGTTYRAPSEYKVWRLQRRLERQAATVMAVPRWSALSWLRVLVQYAVVLPRLVAVRQQLVREHRAPINILFYHLVTNSPVNHMCHGLTTFVRQMEFVRRYFAVLSLEDAVERLRSGKNDELAVAITFDDGYRDNRWAIEYLRYFGIPATFFVSIGHVRDGSSFEHDRKRGFENAHPMSVADLRKLIDDGFTIGSHGVYHENFGSLAPAAADDILRRSRDWIEEACGKAPQHFAFPKGQRGKNITEETLALALKYYPCAFSAYGAHCFPERDRRHFLRTATHFTAFELSMVMSGYLGFRSTLGGDAWGLQTAKLDPCTASPDRDRRSQPARIALIAASPRIVGGQSVQAQQLSATFREAGHDVSFIPIDPLFPPGLRWIRRFRYARTVVNQALYIPSLVRILRADVAHVFSASYWSFLLAPAPAIIAAKLLGKRVVLHYHSGEADDHLRRWRRSVGPFLRLVDEIVVPSVYLQEVFSAHGYRARVIQNLIDTSQFYYRERTTLRPVLLSTRNLESYYDVQNTVAAFGLLKRSFPEATLTIAGVGSHERDLRRLVDESRLSGVRFLGPVEPTALPALYDSADIFVNSSVLDNQPVSILEAFASGLPVVSTPTGDIASMLRGGEAGVLVESNDPSAMAAAVTRLLSEPAVSLKIAQAARKEVERYTPLFVLEKWTRIYDEVLTGIPTAQQPDEAAAGSIASQL